MSYTYNRFETARGLPDPLHTPLADLYSVCEHSGQRLEPTCLYWLEGETPHLVDPNAFDPQRVDDPELRRRLTEDRAMHDVLFQIRERLRDEHADLIARIEASLQPTLRPYPGAPDSPYRREWEYQARRLQESYVFEATLAYGCWQCEACYAAAGILVRQIGVLRLRDLTFAHEPDFSTGLYRLAALLRDAGFFEETHRLLDKSWDMLFTQYGRTGIESHIVVRQMMEIYVVMRLLPPAEVMDIHGVQYTIRSEPTPFESSADAPAPHPADHLCRVKRGYRRGEPGVQ